jgi:hypothetical protein
MRRALGIVVVLAALAGAATAVAAPIIKQNGSDPVFKDFTSICAVPGYIDFGMCQGSASRFADVKGRINAIQPKPGVWNLGLSFSHLEPGSAYRLWGNRRGAVPVAGDIRGFFIVGSAVADATGAARFSYQTTDPTNLGFDLNRLPTPDSYNGTTIVTSYWSSQWLQVLDVDGTLFTPTT